MSDEKLIDWVEANANQTLRFSLDVAESLLKDATFLLNVLIAGAGGSFALVVSLLRDCGNHWLAVPVAASGFYLAIIGWVLLAKVIRTADFHGLGNLPSNLYQPKYSLLDLKEAELANIETKNVANSNRNAKMAQWLDRCRCMALLTPVVFIAAGLAVYLVQGRVIGALACLLG